jgi:diacylglycerol O-acyltransferase / wax synthase
MNLPLDDHAAMYVSASRRRHLPCIGVVQRFDERVREETLAAYAGRLASNPHGFGRRVVAPRIPGARARWAPTTDLPQLRVEPEPLVPAKLAELLDEEVSTQPDPSRAGWRLASLLDNDGRSVVVTWVHHAYGDGRSILETAFAPLAEERASLSQPPPSAIHELGDVLVRLRQGFAGGVRLGREAALVRWRRPDSELSRLAPAVAALRRDGAVGGRSQRRILALVSVDAEIWDRAAAERGGSGNTLLIAMLANLLRLARYSRGQMDQRPLRVLIPVDTRSQSTALIERPGSTATNTAAAAIVHLPGGTPRYGRLEDVRAATRQALRAAIPSAARDAPARPPGLVDAMQLLPNAITHRVASRVQAHADGVASNVGRIPPYVTQLGPHTAREVFLLASPMLTDVTVCLGRNLNQATIGVVADPARLGPVGGLREHVAEELAAWGVEATVS